MTRRRYRTFIGIQGSVMGWDDPWHYRLCGKMMRTGEGKYFPSQDPRPSADEFIAFIKNIGVDFYLHQVMPDEAEINDFIDSIAGYRIPFFLGNEYGNINKINDGINNRYDIPEECVERALNTGYLMGLFYDETEHLQLHPDVYSQNQPEEYRNKPPVHQWTPTEGKGLDEIEYDVEKAVRARVESYAGGIPLYSEQVFPVMYHTLARGGMNPCPKVLKEEFQSLQLVTALGAAKQYNRRMGICIDLWGPDVGNWFTRLWAFPGHSPAEYKSALEMAYLMGPDFMFTENIDPLAVYTGLEFKNTEFGDVFEEFIKKFTAENPIHYKHDMITPDIAVIRADDTDWSESGGFGGRGLYGSLELKGDYKTRSVFKVFHLLSHGKIPSNGISFWLPQFRFPTGGFERTEENVKTLPLVHGVDADPSEYIHSLFYPMNNVAVFDERADDETLGHPKLIFLSGSRMTDRCIKAVRRRVQDGAVCIAAKWLVPEELGCSRCDGKGKWIVTDDFLDPELMNHIESFIGKSDCWVQRFGAYEARFYDPTGDGITLVHDIREAKRGV